MTDKQRLPTPKFAVPVVDAIVVFTIWSLLFWLLWPAVNIARDNQGLPPTLSFLVPWYREYPWLWRSFPIVAPVVFTCFLVAVRAMLPASLRIYLPWQAPSRDTAPKPPKEDSRPAFACAAMAAMATALLIFAASHVRADRTQRRPIVTWEGPAAEYVEHLAVLGWSLSVTAALAAGYALQRYTSRWNGFAYLAFVLGLVNLFVSCLFWAAVFED